MQRLEMRRVARVLRLLSPERAEALVLVLFGGLSMAEAAQTLGKSEAAVKMLIHRGLTELKERLAVHLEVSAMNETPTVLPPMNWPSWRPTWLPASGAKNPQPARLGFPLASLVSCWRWPSRPTPTRPLPPGWSSVSGGRLGGRPGRKANSLSGHCRRCGKA